MKKRRNFIKYFSYITVWSTPIIQSVVLPAHAQTSICTSEVVPGIQISVIDSVTSENISCLATITITDGSYTETLSSDNCSTVGVLEGAYERPGTYQIEVTAPNYISSSMVDIEVTEDECHVITELLEISLVLN